MSSKRLSKRVVLFFGFFFLNPQHLKAKRLKDIDNVNALVSSLFFRCYNWDLPQQTPVPLKQATKAVAEVSHFGAVKCQTNAFVGETFFLWVEK